MKKTSLHICVAAMLWLLMFSPWTAPYMNFWLCMSLSAVVLLFLSFRNQKPGIILQGFSFSATLYGIGSAVLLWGVFWIGNFLSTRWFPFAQGQIDSIYGMNNESCAGWIAMLLLFLIGPAEEIFWRGHIQQKLVKALAKKGRKGLVAEYLPILLSSLIYALVHLWSFNFMLIMAAFVCGLFWGLLYKWDGRLPTVILSHALWDVTVFILLPISSL